MTTLVQVMDWRHQAPNHYLNIYWPSFTTPYGVIRGYNFWIVFISHANENHRYDTFHNFSDNFVAWVTCHCLSQCSLAMHVRLYSMTINGHKLYESFTVVQYIVYSHEVRDLGRLTLQEEVQYIRFAWWRHHVEAFSALLALCAGNSSVTGEFAAQRPARRSFDVFFDLHLNGWASNRDTGDLRCHRAHYDVIVMTLL